MLKGLLSRIYKGVSKLNKNTNDSFKKQAKDWKRLFTKAGMQMAINHMKKFNIMSH